jgi:hypothetical protein
MAWLRHFYKRHWVHSSQSWRDGPMAPELIDALPDSVSCCPFGCRTGTPCTTHFSLMFIPDVFSRQYWWQDDATPWVCSGRSIEYFLRNSFR